MVGFPLQKLLADAGPVYLKDRAENQRNCESLKEAGSVESEDTEDVCNQVDNVTVSQIVLLEMGRAEREISEEEASSGTMSRKKRAFDLGGVVTQFLGRFSFDAVVYVNRMLCMNPQPIKGSLKLNRFQRG